MPGKDCRMARPKFEATKAQIEGAYEAAKKGLTDEEIARAIKVRLGTFKKHKDQFIDVLKKGREEGLPVIIDDLQNALLKKACGYEYTEVHKKKNEKGKVIERREIKKYYPPDTLSLIFTLCNLEPMRYRSVNRVPTAGSNENEPTVEELFSEMAETTPTPYAIPPANNTDQV